MRGLITRKLILVTICSISFITMCINIFVSDNRLKVFSSTNDIEANKSNLYFNITAKTESNFYVENSSSEEDNYYINHTKELPWYFYGGIIKGNEESEGLYPEELKSSGRITQQLMYINQNKTRNNTAKKILMWNGLVSWSGVDTGQKEFSKQKCPVNNCEIVTDRTESNSADLIIFKDHFYSRPPGPRPRDQIWMIYMLGIFCHSIFTNFINNL